MCKVTSTQDKLIHLVVCTGGDDQSLSTARLQVSYIMDSSVAESTSSLSSSLSSSVDESATLLSKRATIPHPLLSLVDLERVVDSCGSAVKGISIISSPDGSLQLVSIGYDQRLNVWSILGSDKTSNNPPQDGSWSSGIECRHKLRATSDSLMWKTGAIVDVSDVEDLHVVRKEIRGKNDEDVVNNEFEALVVGEGFQRFKLQL